MKAVIVSADQLRMIIARLRCLQDSLCEMADDVDMDEYSRMIAEDCRADAEAVGIAADILSAMAGEETQRLVM